MVRERRASGEDADECDCESDCFCHVCLCALRSKTRAFQRVTRYALPNGEALEYLIKQYPLETGALEIQYIEEFFGEFPRKKTAA